ncbi:MAG: primosomal protein N' [Planctomycetaceae bacterium]|nr:primosomal protein N' [Planctomycetaceae bacterium]
MPKQQTLFDGKSDGGNEKRPSRTSRKKTNFSEVQIPPWELDDLANQKTAQVVFPTGYDAVLDYLIPSDLIPKLQGGMRVMVSLGRGNKPALGYCISTGTYTDLQDTSRNNTGKSGIKLKFINSVVDENSLLDEHLLSLARWISIHYLCPLGQVLEAMLPAGVRSAAGTRLTTVLYPAEDVEQRLAVLKETPPPEEKTRRRNSGFLTAVQTNVLDVLRKSGEALTSMELQRAAKCSAAPIDLLKRLGLIRAKTIRRSRPLEEDLVVEKTAPLPLNPEQKRCLTKITEAIKQRRHETFLLHGVTGSGKTEVYIQAIDEVVKQGRQAIVLVPEISLTPQTVSRFKSRFPRVAVLHSHMNDAMRHREWSNIISGEVQVVVGARSAVFAPLPKIGLIVIDEEHENSFKQDTAPRYHARDVARKRAENASIPLILGSATPSLESWYAAVETTNSVQKSTLLSMEHRVNKLTLPEVQIVDLREEVKNRLTRGAIHRQLHSAIYETLQDGGQVILLLNRRGFSTHIQCPVCGEVVRCQNCDVSLTHHRVAEIALCHYCDYQIPAPDCCPKCGFNGIRYGGFGTQKLEAEIRARFPEASVLRMDTDVMQGANAHERALTQFREGKVQILLGTQMIAKGLDFPNVTLVGIVNADTSLHLPDFRASERTFHLITQVAGRTGRGEKGGRVILQTYSPDHAAIQAASQHDYKRFIQQELPVRKLLGYPPWTKMIRIIFRGESQDSTLQFAQDFAARLKEKQRDKRFADLQKQIRILGPAPAPFAQLRGLFRFHIHLHAADSDLMRELTAAVSKEVKTPRDVQWVVDINPLDML